MKSLTLLFSKSSPFNKCAIRVQSSFLGPFLAATLIVVVALSGLSSPQGFAMGKILKHVSQAELSQMPELNLAFPAATESLAEYDFYSRGDIFMIFAHADDELLSISLVSELLRLNPDRKVHWIMVSDNATGKVVSPKCIGISKTECRMREARKVAGCMQLPEPTMMGYRDGKIAEVKDLDQKILARMMELSGGNIGPVFSSDPSGLYGHPDHIAVHDAVLRVTNQLKVPFIQYALTELFKKIIPMKKEAAHIQKLPITHQIEIDSSLQQKLVCAMNSYKSQAILLWHLRQGLSPDQFYQAMGKQFFNFNGEVGTGETR